MIVIRAIRNDEATRLSTFLRATFMATYAHCSSADNVAHFLENQYSADRQAAELADPELSSFVLTEGESWIGVAQLRIINEALVDQTHCTGFVSRFYLESRYHGQGFAQKLLQHLIEKARAAGVQSLQLSAWKQAPQALRFYEKAGFERVASADFIVGSEVLEDWLMQLTL